MVRNSPHENTELRAWIGWIGLAAVVLTLLSAVAAVVAKLGEALERTGRERGWAGAYIAGRRVAHYPAATARLVTGVVVGLIVPRQAVAWQGVFGTYNAKLERPLTATTRSVAEIGPRASVTAKPLPISGCCLRGTPVVLTAAENPSTQPVTVRGDVLPSRAFVCRARTPRPVWTVSSIPRMQQLLNWNGAGGTYSKGWSERTRVAAKQAALTSKDATLAVRAGGVPAVSTPQGSLLYGLSPWRSGPLPGRKWLRTAFPTETRDGGFVSSVCWEWHPRAGHGAQR